jgi:hypothetical protein
MKIYNFNFKLIIILKLLLHKLLRFKQVLIKYSNTSLNIFISLEIKVGCVL